MAHNKDTRDEIIKQGLMVKRSQNKKRFTTINFKQRWFVLTRNFLIYYDSDGDVSTSVKYFSLFGYMYLLFVCFLLFAPEFCGWKLNSYHNIC